MPTRKGKRNLFESYKPDIAQTAVRVLLEFIKNGQITRVKNPELFDEYYKNPDVQMFFENIVNPTADVTLLETPNMVVFCPNPDNRFFGYTNEELRKQMIGSNTSNTDLYLGYFIILCLLAEFYGPNIIDNELSNGGITYVKISELVKTVTDRLQTVADRDEDEISMLEFETDTNLKQAARHWLNKPEYNPRLKIQRISHLTRMGFVLKVCKFLEDEGLVHTQNDREVYLKEKAQLMVRRYYGDAQRKETLMKFILKQEGLT